MRKFFLLALCLCCLPVFSASTTLPVGESDFNNTVFAGKTLKVFENNWKFCKGDNLAYAQATFDDSQWQNIKINTPVEKKNQSKFYWYRFKFELPSEPAKGFYELDMGYISAGDQVFINGVKCGEYGFSQVVKQSSEHRRQYRFCNTNILKKGTNVLAVRVKNGHKFGMYEGIPALRKLQDTQIVGRLNNRSGGKGAVHRHITSIDAINEFYPQDRLFIAPQLTLCGSVEKLAGVFDIMIRQENKTLFKQTKNLVLEKGKWLLPEVCEVKNPGVGVYQIECTFSAANQTIWQQQNHFKVIEKTPLAITVEPNLAKLPAKDFPVKAGEFSYGNLGLRDIDKNYTLFDNYDTPDARSGIANVYGINKKYPGMVLLHSHIKNTPSVKSADFIDQIGWKYDGLTNGWSAGWISPANCSKISNIKTLETAWTFKKIRFEYPNQTFLDMTISQLSPALQISGNTNELICFENFREIGSPRMILSEKSGKLADCGKLITAFEKNYLVVSFRNAPGWKEFDIPYLMVFEKRPRQVELLADGVKVVFAPGRSGVVQIMPLYGVKLQAQDKFSADLQQRARFWSQALLAMPEKVTRTVRIDYAANNMLVRDSFARKIIKDDWNTTPLCLTPVPPSLMLASSSGLKTAISHPVTDLDYAGLNGPFYAIKNVDSYTFALKDVVHLTQEVRKSKNLKNTPAVQAVKKDLLALVRRKIIPEISAHPWQRLVANKSGKAWTPGALEADFTNLLLAMEFLPGNVQKRIIKEVTQEFPLFLDPELKALEKKRGKKSLIKVNTTVYNPLSNKYLNTSTRHVADNGIDGPCWEALRICLVWSYAYRCGNFDWLAKGLPELEKSYNMIVNSHDWAYSLCWDSFAGCRIGNGLQESSIFHAGFAAYARIMHQTGNTAERDRAVYYSLIQLVGMGSSISPETIKFARRNRPVLPDHQQASEVDMLEASYPDRYCEINERGGFFNWIIYPATPYYESIIMTKLPEIMRPFKEQFSQFSQKHFSGKRNGKPVCRTHPFMLDIFCYVSPTPPYPVTELLQIRKNMRLDNWKRLADYRAFLEYNSNIYYEKLWVK